jgi:hypothetical protein
MVDSRFRAAGPIALGLATLEDKNLVALTEEIGMMAARRGS